MISRFASLSRAGYRRALVAALLSLGSIPLASQANSGTLVVSGRILDPEGDPVPAAEVRVARLNHDVSRMVFSGPEGTYLLALPEAEGAYVMIVQRMGYAPAMVDLPAVGGRDRIVLDIRLAAEPLRIEPLRARTRSDRPVLGRTPGGQDEMRLTAIGTELPIAPGDLLGLAAVEPGVLALGDGVSVVGQSPAQNSTLLDGATFGASSVPQEALRSTTMVTSSFDVSRGQYSGGQIAATTLSGTNLFGGALRLRLGHPALQASAAPGVAGGREYTHAQVDGGAGGALIPDQLFYYGAVQATHRSHPMLALETAEPELLRRFGADPDSVRRFQSVLEGLGVGSMLQGPRERARSDAGATLLRFDYNAATDHRVTLRLDGRWALHRGLGASVFAPSSSTGSMRSRAGGVLGQVSSRFDAAENDVRAYVSVGSNQADSDLEGPAGSVRVASMLGGGADGSYWLHFGGSPWLQPDSKTTLYELSDELRLPLRGGAHRIRAGLVLSRERIEQSEHGNTQGTYTFNSLAELEAGRPSTFTRTLGVGDAEAAVDYAALYLGETWRVSDALSLIYGIRLEGRRYPAPAAAVPAIASRFGISPGQVPSEWGASPRFGLSYETPRWQLRGGVGEFRGRVPLSGLARALEETGDPGSGIRLVCIGPAVPMPSWELYATDPDAIATTCTDGAPGFGSRSPHATIFAPGFAAPRVWRASLGGYWEVARGRAGLGGLRLDLDWVRGLSQPVAFDRNLQTAPDLDLTGEAGRQVYVSADEIDPSSGGIAPAGARLYPELGRVREVSARGRSSAGRLLVGVDFLQGLTLWSLHYTWTRAWDEVGALPAPGGGAVPLAPRIPGEPTRGTSDLERRHMVQLRYSRPLDPWPVELGVIGRVTSGAPYTPRTDADVNGDGVANDVAFVFDPATTDDRETAAGMRRLLERGPAEVQECLASQIGRLAVRNSCHGPWTPALDLQANAYMGRSGFSSRFTLAITATNVLAGIDRLVHGAGGVRGWGQSVEPDPVLLQVSGFDPEARRFGYTVNPGFGTPASSRIRGVEPFTLTIQGRWTLGTDPVQQPLVTLFSSVRAQGRSPEAILSELARTVPNLPAQVLSLSDSLGLALTPEQRALLGTAADSLGAELATVTSALAHAISLAERGDDTQRAAAQKRVGEMARQAQVLLDASSRAIQEVLADDQWARLPSAVRIPSRQILPDRPITIPLGEP